MGLTVTVSDNGRSRLDRPMPSWVPDAIWPSAATKASANTDLTFDHSARYPAASSARPVVAVAELAGPQVVGVGPLEEVHPRGHTAAMVDDPDDGHVPAAGDPQDYAGSSGLFITRDERRSGNVTGNLCGLGTPNRPESP